MTKNTALVYLVPSPLTNKFFYNIVTWIDGLLLMVFETDTTCNLQYHVMFCIDLRRVISFSIKGHEQRIQTKLIYILAF